MASRAKPTQNQHCSVTAEFEQGIWETSLLSFLINANLPVNVIDLPEFHSLFDFPARDRPIVPPVLYVRNRIQSLIKDRQAVILERLPADSKLSVSIACWTSSSGQVFVAVNAYFFDKDWKHQEVLLGFDLLSYTEGGTNLDSIVFDIMQEHKITNRVFCMTTDYTINHQDHQNTSDSPEQSIGHMITLIRVPCISHVMHSTLSAILTQVRLDPVPDAPYGGVPRDQGMSQVIDKVISLARHIHAPCDEGRDPSDELKVLLPPLDECPTLPAINIYLTRAYIHQSKIMQFFSGTGKRALLPSKEEWRQIEYLMLITRPFFEFLNDLAMETDATTHLVLLMYRSLFQHLDRFITRLELKTTPWKRGFLRALKVGRQTLYSYYSRIQNMKSYPYAVATVLAPF